MCWQRRQSTLECESLGRQIAIPQQAGVAVKGRGKAVALTSRAKVKECWNDDRLPRRLLARAVACPCMFHLKFVLFYIVSHEWALIACYAPGGCCLPRWSLCLALFLACRPHGAAAETAASKQASFPCCSLVCSEVNDRSSNDTEDSAC